MRANASVNKPARVEKYLLIPIDRFRSFSYVRESSFHCDTIRQVKRKAEHMALFVGYYAVKQRYGWSCTCWWLKDYDQPLDSRSVYQNGHEPCEAVHPADVLQKYFPTRVNDPTFLDVPKRDEPAVRDQRAYLDEPNRPMCRKCYDQFPTYRMVICSDGIPRIEYTCGKCGNAWEEVNPVTLTRVFGNRWC
jgi:hypothetical protein